MFQKRILVLALGLGLSSLSFPALSIAQEVKIDEQTVKEVNLGLSAKPMEKATTSTAPATDTVRSMLQAYMADNNLTQGIDDKGRYFGLAVAAVNSSPTAKDYGKYVQLAYEEAYRKALNQFALSLSREVITEIEDKSYNNQSSDAGEFKDESNQGIGTWESIFKKISALTGAKLDQKLREMGVDPQQYASYPPEQRLKLLEESAIRKTITRVSENVSGVTIVNNQIVENPDGQSAVGIIIATSPKIKAIAESLRYGYKPNESATGPAFEELIPLKDDASLADNWGTRLVVGPNGPAVISFGAWASGYKGANNTLRERYEDSARSQAFTNAEAALSNFLSMTLSSEETNRVGNTLLHEAVKDGKTGTIRPDEVTQKIIQEMQKTMNSRSKTHLTGVRKLKDYTFTDPNGNRIVGCVLVYDFGGVKTVHNFKNPTESKVQSTEQTKEEKPVTGSMRKSSVKSNLDVF